MGLAKELRTRRKVQTREVVVPEWGDESGDFKLYCRPITCNDLNRLQKKHPNFLTNTTIAAMVDLIVMKAEDASGERLFTAADDKIELMGEQTDVISEIANQMFSDIESEENLAKKLKTDHYRFNLISLADRLHMTIEDIEQISLTEFNEWMAYFSVLKDSDG